MDEQTLREFFGAIYDTIKEAGIGNVNLSREEYVSEEVTEVNWTNTPSRELRLGGNLGFGGKLRFSHLNYYTRICPFKMDYYDEERSTGKDVLEARINAALQNLWGLWSNRIKF